MVLFVIGLQTVKDRDGVCYVCVFHSDFLEPSVKGSVLLHDLSELVHSGRSDALDLSSCKRWLEHISRVETSGCSSCSDYGVELVYEQYHIRVVSCSLDDGLEPLFEVSTVLGTSYNGA